MNKSIQILVVDDSALVRQFMSEVIQNQPDMNLLAAAPDPIAAMSKMQKQWPDVILLDVEMPKMDGITFLKQIMAQHPTPIVICSSLTEQGAALTLDAFSAGAVAVFTKAKLGVKQHLQSIANDLVRAIREASQARTKMPRLTATSLNPLSPPATLHSHKLIQTTDRVIAIGTSTGGTIALESILTRLPQDVPGIVIVQHMPEKFTAAFAERLNGICAIEVREARHSERVLQGCALIAPGGYHTQIVRNGAFYFTEVFDAPPVNRHKPSVDVLFRSVAKSAGQNALGMILTGMGDDGARGLLSMRQAGASTIAQDEASSVVFGMPKEAIKLGAAEQVFSLNQMPAMITQFARS
jgi:Chemotaxis response regulator containing a CheY-like receiver domain and a methylesterase domain